MTTDGGSEPTLLLVDDDETFRFVMARALRSRGYRVLEAAGYDDAVIILRVSSPRSAVVDLQMQGPSGLELLRTIKELRPETRVVVLSGNRAAEIEAEAMRLGAAKYLTKPLDADELVAALTKVDPAMG